jgi:5-(carboxyamino)imidazole ribonucleotide synthase
LEQARLLRPAARVLEICQNRMREKRWLRSQGFPHAGFVELQAGDDLRAAAAKVGFPCVLKTADFGYDGKGQRRLADAADAETFAGQVAGGGRWVVERWVDFACELSVIVARGPAGDLAVYPVFSM